MIAHVRGLLVDKSFDRVVVEAAGVGYQMLVSLQTLAELPAAGSEVLLRTYLQVREDAHVLFGFATEAEKRCFELCLSVSGIGPKLALALLSTLRPEELARAVSAGDVLRLSRTPGIGKKTAERLVVDLRDKVDKLGLARGGATVTLPGPAPTGLTASLISALTNLGYRPAEAERAAALALEQKAGAPLEVVLREALRQLTG